MHSIEMTDMQRRNAEILAFDALFYIQKKKHSLKEEEVNELLELFKCDTKSEWENLFMISTT